MEFCSEISLRILRKERHVLDSARIYRKDAEEAANAADRLARACSLLAASYAKHPQMSLVSSKFNLYGMLTRNILIEKICIIILKYND